MMSLLNRVVHMDIFDLCDCVDDNSIDLILSDIPYGLTNCSWDNVIPFEPMWEAFKRIIKPRGAIVLTASGKFTYQLVMSNFEMFKYEWVWDKGQGANMFNAPYRPIITHEFVLVFSQSASTYADDTMNYYPIMEFGQHYKSSLDKGNRRFTFHCSPTSKAPKQRLIKKRYPKAILNYRREATIHPTQKPVALFEYLIRTYTQPGDVVFDPCVGSGTTAIATRNTGRNFIVGDSSAEYVDIARKRLDKPYTMPMFDEQPTQEDKVQQMGMFDNVPLQDEGV
jgi:site-specific DNA-methyltransferase (adenine-specific)